MSYDPILNGSEATPGLWNTRFASIWSSLGTLVGTGFSGVTGARTTSGWSVVAPLSAVSLVALRNLQLPAIAGAIPVVSIGTYFSIYAQPSASPLLQISPAIGTTGRMIFGANGTSEFSADGSLSLSSALWVGATPAQVVTGRKTGWTTVPTGTPIRTTFVTSTATLGDVAQRLAALIIDLSSHGLIGP